MEKTPTVGTGIPFERVTKSCGFIVGPITSKPLAIVKECEDTVPNPVEKGGDSVEESLS